MGAVSLCRIFLESVILKFTDNSLLILAFSYSLFIGLRSVTSGYSDSYHSIKLIPCGVPQIGVLSDKIFIVFILCFASLLYQILL